MSGPAPARPGRRFTIESDHHGYKWVARSHHARRAVATLDSSTVIISLPDIFRGIKFNPLEPGNASYLLWLLMGFLPVPAVLVVTLGRYVHDESAATA